jgi:hypothetical protein
MEHARVVLIPSSVVQYTSLPHIWTDWDVQALSLIQVVYCDVQSHPYKLTDWGTQELFVFQVV